MAAQQQRLPLPDALRGFAAIAVALFHFGAAVPALPAALGSVLSLGWLGVDIFFVLSGFVIARVLSAGAVDPKAFILRRVARLLPGFAVATLLVIGLHWLSSLVDGFRGAPFALPSPGTMACHLSWSCDLFDIGWLNPVFWTLAVEMQFYLVAVMLAVLATRGRAALARVLAAGMLVVCAVFAPAGWFQHYLPLFALGAAAWAARDARLPGQARVALLLVAVALALLHLPAGESLVALSTTLLLALAAHMKQPRWCLWLGAVSYSLYLIHVPIGGRVINLAMRMDLGPLGAISAIALALALSLLAAWIMTQTVESAALRWSARIRYRPAKPTVAHSPARLTTKT